MQTQPLHIQGIPALLWGPAQDKVIIAVHGDQSHKADDVTRLLAEVAVGKGCQALSFDLPEHGDRQAEARPCTPWNSVEDLARLLAYARAHFRHISLFGCSIGAYFSLLAYQHAPLRQALFLSPVVDMARLIRNMMAWFNVSEERLEKEQTVATPMQPLSWDYYQYVLAHSVVWNHPTALLYGAKDTLCEPDVVQAFARRTRAALTVMEDGEHFFHTAEQLTFLRAWLHDTLNT